MRVNKPQKIVLAAALIMVSALALFPPWRQAAEREKNYRLYLGREFILRRPAAVPVDCYFAGCTTAPASYFHVLLYWNLLLEQIVAVAAVAVGIAYLFHTLPDGTHVNFAQPKTRLIFGMLIALLVPAGGGFPLASDLLRIPKLFFHQDEFWLVGTIAELLIYACSTFLIYGLLSAIVRIRKGGGHLSGAGGSGA